MAADKPLAAQDRVLCLGWAELEGTCERYTHGPKRDSPLWCDECEERRIAYLSGQFAKITKAFDAA